MNSCVAASNNTKNYIIIVGRRTHIFETKQNCLTHPHRYTYFTNRQSPILIFVFQLKITEIVVIILSVRISQTTPKKSISEPTLHNNNISKQISSTLRKAFKVISFPQNYYVPNYNIPYTET